MFSQNTDAFQSPRGYAVAVWKDMQNTKTWQLPTGVDLQVQKAIDPMECADQALRKVALPAAVSPPLSTFL
jgi:hypothetical protein